PFNQPIWEALPRVAEDCQCWGVDGDAASLDASRDAHELTTEQRTLDVEHRQHAGEELLRGRDVTHAVTQQVLLLRIGPGATAQRQGPHVLLLDGVHDVEAEVRQGPKETVAGHRGSPVGQIPELDVEVEYPLRQGPAEREVAPQLGADVVADKQHVGASRIGRTGRSPEVIFAQGEGAAAAEFACDQAEWMRRLAWGNEKLGVTGDHLAKLESSDAHQISPRRFRRTG